MTDLKSPLLAKILIFIGVTTVLTIAVGQIQPLRLLILEINKNITKGSTIKSSNGDLRSPISQEPSSDYLMSAKKLHNPVSYSEWPTQTIMTLEQRIKALNQQIATLSKQMNAHNIASFDTGTQNPQRNPENSDTHAHSKSIQSHVNSRAENANHDGISIF